MDKQMRKLFALRTEMLGGDPGDVKSLKVLNRQILWTDGEIHWEADPRHVEILTRQLGMDGSTSVKTLGGKNDADKLFRYRVVDGEGATQEEETACYIDELYSKSASLGRFPTSRLMRQVEPKLAQWADLDADDAAPDMSEDLQASCESRRRAALRADGWMEGPDSPLEKEL